MIVLATIFASFLITLLVWLILFKCDIISTQPFNPADKYTIVWIIIMSIAIGAMNALFVGTVFIKPMQDVSDKFDKLSKGDFSIRVPDDKNIKEIREMATCFNSMVEDLSQVESLRNDFAINVSHEFKTPIATIEGYATLLQDDSLSVEDRQRYTEKILESSSRLSALVSNILALSRLENQQTVYNKTKYRLDEQLRRVVLLLEDKWEQKDINIDINLYNCDYVGNESLLDQVWINILDNAIKHTEQGGKIKIRLATSLSSVAVTISDNGCGMNEEVLKHLFEKFYQGDASRKTDGNGLGLVIVKRIVDLCDGEISVTSKVGKGTVVTVVLPRSILTLHQL
jgi:signal transduction histidine kinase